MQSPTSSITSTAFAVSEALFERARALAEEVATEDLHPTKGPADPEVKLSRS